jgi:hypothetical protein
MTKAKTYQTCLPDLETALSGLATIIDADYTPGTFSRIEDAFQDSGQERDEWTLLGRSGVVVTVVLEKYEGYLFIKAEGIGHAFQKAKEHLWECYVSQGGNPDKQERP